MDVNKDFEKWWDENEKQIMADSCHMSEFHMASVVWEAAAKAEREALRKAITEKADEWDDRAEAHGMLLARDIVDERSNAAVSRPREAD